MGKSKLNARRKKAESGRCYAATEGERCWKLTVGQRLVVMHRLTEMFNIGCKSYPVIHLSYQPNSIVINRLSVWLLESGYTGNKQTASFYMSLVVFWGPWTPRSSLSSGKFLRLWAMGWGNGMCPGHQGLGIGVAQLRCRSLSCSWDWCELCLGLWSLLELWRVPDFRKDDEIGGDGQQSGS